MKLFALTLTVLLGSSTSFAQKPLTKESFQVSVRPVLNALVDDFYQMVTLFPDYPRELNPVVKEMSDLGLEKENLLALCPRTVGPKCLSTIDALRTKLSSINQQTLVLLRSERPASSLYINSMGGMRLINQFHSLLTLTKGKLDNSSFLIRAQIRDQKDSHQIVKELDELKSYLALAVVEFIPFTYREDFRHFFFNFVHPVEQHVSQKRNHEFFYRNIDSMNFSLNLLNMNLTKRNKKTPEGMGPYLNTIHNRWNSILRYYM